MDNNAVVKQGDSYMVMRLVDGEFPDYKRVSVEKLIHMQGIAAHIAQSKLIKLQHLSKSLVF